MGQLTDDLDNGNNGPEGPYYYEAPAGPYRPRIWLPAVLFAVTVVTTLIAGSIYAGADVFRHPSDIVEGIPFSASLLLILGTHELGHFAASRRHGVATTLPMFIPGPPFPPPMIGTFGAVIRIKSPITTKKALVDIGAAGPLSGFVVALFVTYIGLRHSTVIPVMQTGVTFGLGDSLILKLLIRLAIGPVPEGFDVFLHPMAFAGWIGFFVTAMNLLPMGQLDGGHIVFALIGRHHRPFSIAMAAALVALGFFTWPGWFVWAALITIIGMWHPPVEDHEARLDGARKAVCAATLTVFVLTFIPMPVYIV